MPPHDRPRVSVVGGSTADDEDRKAAEALGTGLADLDVTLFNGGLGGTMAATGAGYKEADGPLYVGILPGDDPGQANGHVDVPVATGLGHARNMIVALNGDVVCALPGGGGTLSEIGYARVFGRPVVAVGSWPEFAGIHAVETVEEALEQIAARIDG